MDKFVISIPKQSCKRPHQPVPAINNSLDSCSKKIKANSTKKSSQMFLDLGQKSFGSNKTCSKCGFFYVIGDTEDEKRHQDFCKSVKRKHCLPSLTNHQTLTEYDSEQGQVIRFNMEKKLHRDTLAYVMSEVEQDLGTSSDFLSSENKHQAVYLYLSSNDLAIIGVLVAEEVAKDSLVSLSKEADITKVFTTISTCHYHQRDDDASHTSTTRTTLGIKLIWTRQGHRNQQVASRLVDTARRYFCFGKIISQLDVGFSQPTKNGLDFALSYSKVDQIWGYA